MRRLLQHRRPPRQRRPDRRLRRRRHRFGHSLLQLLHVRPRPP
jgi:hypothetical protein